MGAPHASMIVVVMTPCTLFDLTLMKPGRKPGRGLILILRYHDPPPHPLFDSNLIWREVIKSAYLSWNVYIAMPFSNTKYSLSLLGSTNWEGGMSSSRVKGMCPTSNIRLGWAIFYQIEGGFNYSREMGLNTILEWVDSFHFFACSMDGTYSRKRENLIAITFTLKLKRQSEWTVQKFFLRTNEMSTWKNIH